MLTNNKLRALFIAAAASTLVACASPSGPTAKELAADEEARQAEIAAQKQQEIEAEKARVEAEKLEKIALLEEEKKEQKEALVALQTVYFDFDRSSIKSEYMSVLDKHAEFLVAYPDVSVTIEGHCDSRGTPEYNIALGERRAKAVAEYLTNAGVSSSQIETVSFGEEKLAVSGTSEFAMAQNRRGVLVY